MEKHPSVAHLNDEANWLSNVVVAYERLNDTEPVEGLLFIRDEIALQRKLANVDRVIILRKLEREWYSK